MFWQSIVTFPILLIQWQFFLMVISIVIVIAITSNKAIILLSSLILNKKDICNRKLPKKSYLKTDATIVLYILMTISLPMVYLFIVVLAYWISTCIIGYSCLYIIIKTIPSGIGMEMTLNWLILKNMAAVQFITIFLSA